MDKNQKQRLAEKIWSDFNNQLKIFNTPEFIKEYGEIGELPRSIISMSLSSLLHKQFCNIVQENGYTNSLLSSESFYRILKTGITGNTNTETLNMFSVYLGYTSLEDYATKKPITNDTSTKDVINEFIEPTKKKSYFWAVVSVLGLLGISLLIWNNLSSERTYNSVADIDSTTQNEIFSFVKEAADVELKTYQKLPIIDTTMLSKYYDNKCESYWGFIIRLINVHHNLNLVVTNKDNPTRYRIDSMKVTRVNKDTVFVNTKEFWYLRWYYSDSLKYDLTRERMRDFANTYGILIKNGKKKIVSYNSVVAKRY